MRHVEGPEVGPKEGREQEGSPKTRTHTEAGPLGTKWMHALDSPVQRVQEEEEKRDSPEGRQKRSKDTPQKKAGTDGKKGRTDLWENIKSGEKDAYQQEGKEVQDNEEREVDNEERMREQSSRGRKVKEGKILLLAKARLRTRGANNPRGPGPMHHPGPG